MDQGDGSIGRWLDEYGEGEIGTLFKAAKADKFRFYMICVSKRDFDTFFREGVKTHIVQ